MHMHEIMEAFTAEQDCQPMSCVSQRTRLLFSLRLLYSNLFLDRLDEIKWRVVGDGCQEEAGSFFWLPLVAIRASDLAESMPATLSGSIALTLQQNLFLFCDWHWFSTHKAAVKCINVFMGKKLSPSGHDKKKTNNAQRASWNGNVLYMR